MRRQQSHQLRSTLRILKQTGGIIKDTFSGTNQAEWIKIKALSSAEALAPPRHGLGSAPSPAGTLRLFGGRQRFSHHASVTVSDDTSKLECDT